MGDPSPSASPTNSFPPRGRRHLLGWQRPSRWVGQLTAALPHPLPTSNHRLLPIEKALAFMHGRLCDARKLTHVAYLRRAPLVPEVLGITRVPSQTARSRFFQGFDSAGASLPRHLRLLPFTDRAVGWLWDCGVNFFQGFPRVPGQAC